MANNPNSRSFRTPLQRLTHYISQPGTSFNEPVSCTKEIWSTDASQPELEQALRLSNGKLEVAIKQQIRAHKAEMEKLKARLETLGGGGIPQHADFENLKGDICQQVLERWEHEKKLEEMTGRRVQR